MQVNSINNISFAGNEKKPDLKQKNNNYFKYVSQVHANDALKMSVGREDTDGKFKVAKEATKVAGWLGIGISSLCALNMSSEIAKTVQQRKSQFEIIAITQKYAKPIGIGSVVSSALLIASKVIDFTNKILADKTAEKRGFIKPLTRFKNKDEAYKATENVYSTYVKK